MQVKMRWRACAARVHKDGLVWGGLWGLAAVGALVCALFSTLTEVRGPSLKNSGLVARVNGEGISDREYARALSAMQAGISRALTQQDKQRALTLLINEELMVQEAIALGLAREDRLIRKNLVQAMLRSVVSLEAEQPDEESLRSFFRQEKNLFAVPPLFSVEALKVINQGAVLNVKAALARGEAFQKLKKAPDVVMLPVPLRQPLGKLADLLGGDAANVIVEMQAGDIVGPLTLNGEAIFLWLRVREGGAPDFDEIRNLVEDEWQRRADERAFEAYAERLRKGARIKVFTE